MEVSHAKSVVKPLRPQQASITKAHVVYHAKHDSFSDGQDFDTPALRWHRALDDWEPDTSQLDIQISSFEEPEPPPTTVQVLPVIERPLDSYESDDEHEALLASDGHGQRIRELWHFLNMLEMDAHLVPTAPNSLHARHDSDASFGGHVDRLIDGLVSAELELDELIRDPRPLDDAKRSCFVMACRNLLSDLESPFFASSTIDIAKLLDRVHNILRRYHDILDPLIECTMCMEHLRRSQYPYKITSACYHPPDACRSCLANWVASSLEMHGLCTLRCMGCLTVLTREEFEAIARPETIERWDELETRQALAAIPNFHWCLNTQCTSGQIHYGGAKMKCHACRNLTCVKHGVAWHEGETCATYDEKRRHVKAENSRSEVLKSKTSKSCPVCRSPIEKDGGCSQMRCRNCDTGFEWAIARQYQAKTADVGREADHTSPVVSGSRPRRMTMAKETAKKLIGGIFSAGDKTSEPEDVLIWPSTFEIECGIPEHEVRY